MIEYTIPANRILHSTKVDFSHRVVNKAIHVVQYDKQMPIIAVELNLSSASYTVPAGMEVRVRWSKPDNTFVYKDVLGSNADRTIVYFDVDEQMSFYSGSCDPIIELYISDTEKAGSSPIPIVIDKNPIQDSDIISTVEYADLQQAVLDAQQAVVDAQGHSDEALAQANIALQAAIEAAASAAEALGYKNELDAKIDEVDVNTVKSTKNEEQIKVIEETLRKSMDPEGERSVEGELVIDLPKDIASGSPLRFGMNGATEGINKVAYVNKTIDEVVYTNKLITEVVHTNELITEVVYEGMTLQDIFETANKFTNPHFDDASPLWGVNSGYSQHDAAQKAMKAYLNAAGTSVSIFNALGIMYDGGNFYISAKLFAETTTIAFKYYHGSGYTSFPQIIEEGWKHYSKIYTADLDTYMHFNIWHNTAKTWMVTTDDVFMIDMSIFTVEPTDAQMDSWRDMYLTRRLTQESLTLQDIFETNNLLLNPFFEDGENNWDNSGNFTALVDGNILKLTALLRFAGYSQTGTDHRIGDNFFAAAKAKLPYDNSKIYINDGIAQTDLSDGQIKDDTWRTYYGSRTITGVYAKIVIQDNEESGWQESSYNGIVLINKNIFSTQPDDVTLAAWYDLYLSRRLITKEKLTLKDIFGEANELVNPHFDDGEDGWFAFPATMEVVSKTVHVEPVANNPLIRQVAFVDYTPDGIPEDSSMYLSADVKVIALDVLSLSIIDIRNAAGDKTILDINVIADNNWVSHSDIVNLVVEGDFAYIGNANNIRTGEYYFDNIFVINNKIFDEDIDKASMDTWRDMYLARRLITKKVLAYKDIFENINIVDWSTAVARANTALDLLEYGAKLTMSIGQTYPGIDFTHDGVVINQGNFYFQMEYKSIKGVDNGDYSYMICNINDGSGVNISPSGDNVIESHSRIGYPTSTTTLISIIPRRNNDTDDIIVDLYGLYTISLDYFDESITQVMLDELLVYYKKYREWLIESVKFNKRLKSINKNIIKTDNLSNETINDSGINSPATNIIRDNNMTKVLVGKTYIYSVSGDQVAGEDLVLNRIVEYDVFKNFIRRYSPGLLNPIGYSPLLGVAYVELYYRTVTLADITPEDIKSALPMLEIKQSVPASEYIPYTETFKYILPNKVGNELPDGVTDTIEYRDGKYYHIQRVGSVKLIEDDILNFDNSSYTELDFIQFNKEEDSKVYGVTNITTGFELEGYLITGSFSGGESNYYTLLANFSSLRFTLFFPAGEYADVNEVKSALSGLTLIYELANYIETEVQVMGNISGFPLGHVYVESAIQSVALYGAQMDVDDVNYPIEILEYIEIVHSDSSITKLDINTAVIAGDGLSFTHPDLALGDVVYFTYFYQDPNSYGDTIIYYFENTMVIQDSVTGEWKKWSVTLTDGVFAIVGEDV